MLHYVECIYVFIYKPIYALAIVNFVCSFFCLPLCYTHYYTYIYIYIYIYTYLFIRLNSLCIMYHTCKRNKMFVLELELELVLIKAAVGVCRRCEAAQVAADDDGEL